MSPIYSVYESDSVETAGPIFACLKAFACSLLKGFEIRLPPPISPVTVTSLPDEYRPRPPTEIQDSFRHQRHNPIAPSNNDRSQNTETVLSDPKIHSLGPIFDGFGLGMQVLDRSVCCVFLDPYFHKLMHTRTFHSSTSPTTRQATHTLPPPSCRWPLFLFRPLFVIFSGYLHLSPYTRSLSP